MKKNKLFISTEKINQIKPEIIISEEDIKFINLKPRFPVLAYIQLKIWLFFNKIR